MAPSKHGGFSDCYCGGVKPERSRNLISRSRTDPAAKALSWERLKDAKIDPEVYTGDINIEHFSVRQTLRSTNTAASVTSTEVLFTIQPPSLALWSHVR